MATAFFRIITSIMAGYSGPWMSLLAV